MGDMVGSDNLESLFALASNIYWRATSWDDARWVQDWLLTRKAAYEVRPEQTQLQGRTNNNNITLNNIPTHWASSFRSSPHKGDAAVQRKSATALTLKPFNTQAMTNTDYVTQTLLQMHDCFLIHIGVSNFCVELLPVVEAVEVHPMSTMMKQTDTSKGFLNNDHAQRHLNYSELLQRHGPLWSPSGIKRFLFTSWSMSCAMALLM